MEDPMLSFVIPLKDEQDTIRELHLRIEKAVNGLGRSFEIVFVDDGSEDQSWSIVRSLVESRSNRVRGIRFRRNLGKAAALAAGFHAARGEVVFTLDADLQDDPQEIGRFLAKLAEGYDIVSGWKRVRHDPWHKVLPSRIFNAMLSAVSRTRLHDHNCGFKCYSSNVVKELSLYGEMHRMIPALSSIRGFRSTEIEVTHHPRRFGRSKYGVKRFLRGFMDMITVGFLQNYRERPLHLLGGMALILAALGILAITAGLMIPVTARASMSLEMIGGVLVAGSAPLMGMGFLGELLVHALPPPQRSLPIIEELQSLPIAQEAQETELTIGASLSIVEGSGPDSARGRVSSESLEVSTVGTVSARVA
jgi:glycosyltransferase involved in cell wall biosynthesis